MACDGGRNRGFVAWNAGDQRRPADTVCVELLNPPIRQRLWCAGILPFEQAVQIVQVRLLACERREERGRKEMSVRVVDQNVIRNPS
jgi:hypothetical protein